MLLSDYRVLYVLCHYQTSCELYVLCHYQSSCELYVECYYQTIESKTVSNQCHRPISLGIVMSTCKPILFLPYIQSIVNNNLSMFTVSMSMSTNWVPFYYLFPIFGYP